MVTVDHPDQNRRVSDFAALDHESGTKSLGHGWVDMAGRTLRGDQNWAGLAHVFTKQTDTIVYFRTPP